MDVLSFFLEEFGKIMTKDAIFISLLSGLTIMRFFFMKNTRKAFSFVELIVVLAILALIWVVWFTMYNSSNEKSNNSKVVSGAKTLKNAFTSYKEVNKSLPSPNWNNNYFKADSTYAHSGSLDAFWVYGSVTQDTLSKKYLDNLPLDPISNHYYSIKA